MKLKELVSDTYQVVAWMEGNTCALEEELLDLWPSSTFAYRSGLVELLVHVASHGFHGLSSKKCHEVDKKHGIHEFIKGDQRLFFFNGAGKQIVVCTGLGTKKGAKADPKQVNHARRLKQAYMLAHKQGSLEVVQDENE